MSKYWNAYWGKVLLCGLITTFVLGLAALVQAQPAGRTIRNSPVIIAVVSEKLYPAYVTDSGVKHWGYINLQGTFRIAPRYEWVHDYEANGRARVAENGKVGVINVNGQYVFEPVYHSITAFSDGAAVAFDGKTYGILNEAGKVVYQTEDYIGPFLDGLALIRKSVGQNKWLYGYINTKGNIVIQPQFLFAGNFQQQKAVVQAASGKYQVIDREGRVLFESSHSLSQKISEDIVIIRYRDDEFGYMTLGGAELFAQRFCYAGPFEGGLAIVNVSKSYIQPRYGVINKQGEYVIAPEYAQIKRIGEGMFAASSQGLGIGSDIFSRKAIFNNSGKRLTDFRYFDIGEFSEGVVSVSEDYVTYFLNKNGEKVDELPQLAGVGVIKVEDDVITANIDDDLMYITKTGKVIWQAANEWNFGNGLLRTFKFRPDRCMLIKYPQVLEHKDPVVQEMLNRQLKALFIGSQPASRQEDGVYAASTTVNFTLREQQKLLIIEKNDYYYPVGAAHGMPARQYYHFNFTTGQRFWLADLFKKDSNFREKIAQRITGMISERNQQQKLYYVEQLETIRSDQEFTVSATGLKVIFQPYEIAPYAAGFPEFIIRWEELIDMVDIAGSFWRSFHG